MMINCICRRCTKCMDRIGHEEPVWKKLCLPCYRSR
jgi:hypothetical protein